MELNFLIVIIEKNMKNYLLGIFSITILLISCNNDNEATEINDFKGVYKIKSIESSMKVDLNNDNLASKDYLQEIASNLIFVHGQYVNMGYEKDLKRNYAEVRPTKLKNTNTKFLDIKFPLPRIDSLFQGNDTYKKYYKEHEIISTALIYKLTNNNNVDIESDPFDEFQYHKINNFIINRVNKIEFEIKFDKKLYDFSNNKWVLANLTARYERIGD